MRGRQSASLVEHAVKDSGEERMEGALSIWAVPQIVKMAKEPYRVVWTSVQSRVSVSGVSVAFSLEMQSVR